MKWLSYILFAVLIMFNSDAQNASSDRLIAPPFVRSWTRIVGERPSVIAVRANLIYYASNEGMGALDLTTGKPLWSVSVGDRVDDPQLLGDNLYAISETGEHANLVKIDIRTHQAKTLTKLAWRLDKLAVDATHLFVLGQTGMLTAYDPGTGSVLWSIQVGPKISRGYSSVQLVPTAGGIYVGIDNAGSFGVDLNGKKVLWHLPGAYAGLYRPIRVGDDVILQHDHLERVNVGTGNIAWKADQVSGDAQYIPDVVVSTDNKGLVGYDARNGHVLWHLPTADAGTSYSGVDEAPIISDGEMLWVARNPVLCVTRGGQQVWSYTAPYTGAAAYADNAHLVTMDEDRLLAYVPGQLPPLPASAADRQALVTRLASQYEIIDTAERAQLVQLGTIAFKPLLERYMDWAQ